MSAPKEVSRQRKFQLALIAKGLCSRCGNEPLHTKTLGPKCAKKAREQARKKNGSETRYKSAKSYAPPSV
jgi:hypothetical protein